MNGAVIVGLSLLAFVVSAPSVPALLIELGAYHAPVGRDVIDTLECSATRAHARAIALQ